MVRLDCLRFFLLFLKKIYIVMRFPTGLLLLHPTDFVQLCFHCHLCQGIFNSSLLYKNELSLSKVAAV